MRKLLLVFAMAACLVGVTGQASAATTDTITVTVSLAEVISVTLDQPTWVIGAIAIDFISASFPVIATNEGNVRIDLNIDGTDGAGGWTLGNADASNVFAVGVTPAVIAAFPLTTGAGDTQGGGTSQDFTVTLTASEHVP